MSSKIEAKRAELALLEAEEAFAAIKAEREPTNEEKLALRELRREYRENYRQPADGANPGAISSKVTVQ